MKTVWDAETRTELMQRMNRLKPDMPPQWGKMNAAQMVGHVMDPMRAAMGEMKVADKKTPFRFAPLRWLIIYKLPWPKGAPTAPEFIHQGNEDLQKNLALLKATLDRFAAFHRRNLEAHPAFGSLTDRDWGCLTWRHMDHHLRQFGL
jgi:hypothetical protein